MNTRGIIGKRIAAVHQTRQYNTSTKNMCTHIHEIVLDDGTVLRPVTTETIGDPYVDFVVVNRTLTRELKIRH